MTDAITGRGIAAILLDIEGTTTPMAFVHEILFPFAREHLHGYLSVHREHPDLRRLILTLARERASERPDADAPTWHDTSPGEALASAEAYARWLMARDRKSPALKELQGWIWQAGYQAGLLKGEIFPDVPPAIRRWRTEGRDVAIYSSGSVLAQRLLFGSTAAGDMTPLIVHFFDTAVGPKTSAASYAEIARALGRAPAEILFVSDVPAELHAARRAGLHVRLSVRPGNPPVDAAGYEIVRQLDEVM